MLFAVDHAEVLAKQPEVADAAALLAVYEAVGRPLENAQHMPSAFDELLALDDHLEAARYPPGFRYSSLLLRGPSIPLRNRATDFPMLGWIEADVVRAAAEKPRGFLDTLEAVAASPLEELLEDASLAAQMRCGLAGVYT